MKTIIAVVSVALCGALYFLHLGAAENNNWYLVPAGLSMIVGVAIAELISKRILKKKGRKIG